MYRLAESENVIIRIEDLAAIPNDPGNRDYQDYLAWVDIEGNTPEPYVPPPPPVPQRVTRRQGRLALLESGKLAEVEGMIAGIEDPVEQMAAQIEYEADTWERSNLFLQSMWALVSDPKPPLDDLFTLAASK